MQELPLKGIRVLDVTNSWSGPFTSNMLAAYGAETIKVESIQYTDTWRGAGTVTLETREQFWERSPLWNSVNTDKLSITLDLSRSQGVDIFKQLVKISDVVAENYTPRVMKNFGLDYPVLKHIHSEIIMISLPAYGTTGPWRDYPGFAASIEQMAGFPQLTGYPDGPPKMSGAGFTDAVSGVNGMMAVMFALLFRQMTGKGQHIDLSQLEAATGLIGDAIVDYSMNKRITHRRGNRHPYMAPHGYYRCKGEDMWVGIAISSDKEWEQFGQVMGNPPWVKEDRFTDSLNRWHHQDELDPLIEKWTIQQDHYDVMITLQKAGIAAGAVLTSAELLQDPHLQARGTFQRLDRAIVGNHPYPVPTAPAKLSKSPISIRRPAPLLGEHNEYVFGDLLGMSTEEIQHLMDDQIIGKAPLMDE